MFYSLQSTLPTIYVHGSQFLVAPMAVFSVTFTLSTEIPRLKSLASTQHRRVLSLILK